MNGTSDKEVFTPSTFHIDSTWIPYGMMEFTWIPTILTVEYI